jgi:hypothetical protein
MLRVINDNGQVKFISGADVLEGTWKLDASHTPIELDLTLLYPQNEWRTVPAVIRFITEDKLLFRNGVREGERSTWFSKDMEKNQMIFERL